MNPLKLTEAQRLALWWVVRRHGVSRPHRGCLVAIRSLMRMGLVERCRNLPGGYYREDFWLTKAGEAAIYGGRPAPDWVV